MHRSYYYDHQPPRRTLLPMFPRKKSGMVIFILLVLILLVAFATGVVMLVNQTRLMSSSSSGERPAISTPSQSEEDAGQASAEPSAEPVMAQATLGDGTHLTLVDEAEGEALSFQEIYSQNINSIVSVQSATTMGTSAGTGVIFSEDGYIITNAHVIEDAYAVEILLYDERSYPALLVGSDSDSDLAVLKIDASNLSPAVFGDSDALEVGDVALAIGNPLGDELIGTMTDGIISAINRDVSVDGNTMVLLQTTAALNSGNSGGALINDHGQVIGITTLKMMSDYDTIEGLGFAIPSVTVKAVVDDLIAYGHRVNQPTIGIVVNTYAVTLEDGATGLTVISVEEVSDAYAQGLLPEDVIVEVNGQAVTSMEVITDIKAELDVGDILTCKIWREDEYLTIAFALIDTYMLDE